MEAFGAVARKTLLYIFLILWLMLTVIPLLWMLISSFRTNEAVFTNPFGWPTVWHFANYAQAWVMSSLGTGLGNSLLVSAGAALLVTVCAALIGFSLSRGEIPGSRFIQTFFLVGMMIPIFSVLIPLLVVYQHFGLLNTYIGLIIVYAGFNIPLGVLLFRTAFDGLPGELIDAAAVDGCSVPRTFFQVLLPLVSSTSATFGVLSFLNAWNDFIFAVVFISDNAHRTLPLSLMAFSGQYGTDYVHMFAALTISIIPTIIIYLLFQDRIQSSMAMGSIK